jgi:hypothetical protein
VELGVPVPLPLIWISVPIPVKATLCGLPAASSLIVRIPLLVPLAVGWKTTASEQVPPGASTVQLLVWLKSPVTEVFETLSAMLPLLVKVMVCAALAEVTTAEPKSKVVAESNATAPDPDPVSGIVIWPGVALEEITTLPVRAPSPLGVKLMAIWHALPEANVAGQSLLSLKSPCIEIPEIETGPPPVFVTVND